MLSLFFILYAETHYSFKGIYSRLKKNEPEILADVPHRLEPGIAIPILILIKDAHLQPIILQEIRVDLFYDDSRLTRRFDFNVHISDKLWRQILEINPLANTGNALTLDVVIKISINGKIQHIRNDNYNGTSHAPFVMQVAESPLPRTEGWYFGEFHCHTSYTSDQVEFGAPLDATARLAQAMGLSFFCATDHSYDLDDLPDDYLHNDPDLTKWQDFRQEVHDFNENHADFVIVPGEEVSAGNSRNRNVHFLILNHPEFLPGDGDSAERWFRTQPQLSIEQILEKIESGSAAFAAHPAIRPPFLEWLLVRRGKWEIRDCSHSGLHGLQIWNGTEAGFEKGKQMWIKLLLQGRRLFISGGNDAHGNFNRFRQIGFPFFTMRENHQNLFGKVRTGVYLKSGLSLNSLLDAFKNGRMLVTDGPFVDFHVKNESDQIARCGGEIAGNKLAMETTCLSSPEFGQLKYLKIYLGNLKTRKEQLFKNVTEFSGRLKHHEITEITTNDESYLRVELYSEKKDRVFRCRTNPIWVKLT